MKKDIVFRLFFIYWFIYLFQPFRFISYYFPFLKFLNSIDNPLFWAIILWWLFASNHEKNFGTSAQKLFLFFLCSVLISVLIARNTGRARITFIDYIYLYFRIAITISLLKDFESLLKLIKLHYISLIFVGIIGIFEGGKLPSIPQLNDENFFGAYMTYGVAYSWFFYRSEDDKKLKRYYLGLFVFFIFAVGTSLSRGAFVGLAVLILYIIFRHPHKFKMFIRYAIITVFAIVIMMIFYKESSVVKEISSIFNQKEEVEQKKGTLSARFFLWQMALKIYTDHNLVFGVGPRNFGVWVPEYASVYWQQRVGLAYYDQVVHNDYITVLTELGIMGLLIYIIFLIYFLKLNSKTRKKLKELSYLISGEAIFNENHYNSIQRINRMQNVTYALEGNLLVTLLNHIVCPIFYYHRFFWLLFIFNLVLYLQVINLNYENKIEDTVYANN